MASSNRTVIVMEPEVTANQAQIAAQRKEVKQA